jgi:DNA repair protein RadC
MIAQEIDELPLIRTPIPERSKRMPLQLQRDAATLFANLTGADYDTAMNIFSDGITVAKDRIKKLPQGMRERAANLFDFAILMARMKIPDGEILKYPADTAAYLHLRYMNQRQEVFGALFLDVRHRLIREAELFRGTQHRTSVEPKPFFAMAIELGAAALVLFHTHPSGDPTPSSEDRSFTRRMVEAGEFIGIRVVDHLIIGSADRWVSLEECGPWDS